MLLIISLTATAMRSQEVKKLLSKDGVVLDSIFVPEFPLAIPAEFTYLSFKEVVSTRMHNDRIDLVFDNVLEDRRTDLSNEEIKLYRKSLAIYYTVDDISKSVLWRKGSSVSSVSFSPNRNGLYIVVLMKIEDDTSRIISSFLGKVFMVKVKDGDVVIYTALQPD